MLCFTRETEAGMWRRLIQVSPTEMHPDLSPHLQPKQELKVPALQAASNGRTWVNSGNHLCGETHGPGLQLCDQVAALL